MKCSIDRSTVLEQKKPEQTKKNEQTFAQPNKKTTTTATTTEAATRRNSCNKNHTFSDTHSHELSGNQDIMQTIININRTKRGYGGRGQKSNCILHCDQMLLYSNKHTHSFIIHAHTQMQSTNK